MQSPFVPIKPREDLDHHQVVTLNRSVQGGIEPLRNKSYQAYIFLIKLS